MSVTRTQSQPQPQSSQKKKSNFFSSSYNYLISYDNFGPTPSLNFNGHGEYSTLLGLFLTLISVSLGLFLMKFELENFWHEKNPIIYNSQFIIENPIVLNNTEFKLFVNVYHVKNYKYIAIDKSELDGIELLKYELTPEKFMRTKLGNMIPCDKSLYTDIEYLDLSNDTINNSMCMPNNISLSTSKYVGLNIAFPMDKINYLREKYKMLMVFIDYQKIIMQPDNYKHFWRKELETVKIFPDYDYYVR